jgi:O-antigen ligase
LGVFLFALAVVWMAWASVESGGSPVPGIELLLGCGLVLIAARTIGSRSRVFVPAAVFLAAGVVAARSKTGVLSTEPLSGPLAYLNADGAFYAQASIAGLMMASAARSWFLRGIGVVGAVVFAMLPFIVHALAAAALVVVLPVIALGAVAVAGAHGARASVAILGFLFAATLAATIVLGGSYSQSTGPTELASIVDRARLTLWHDAFGFMRDHPATGVGPRRFQVVSSIARGNKDYRWAHNEFLQQGAEGGVAGLVLLALIFLWGFARLWVVRIPGAVTALGAVSLAALGIHACVDYVMHFPAIPLMAAGLVATGMTDRQTR